MTYLIMNIVVGVATVIIEIMMLCLRGNLLEETENEKVMRSAKAAADGLELQNVYANGAPPDVAGTVPGQDGFTNNPLHPANATPYVAAAGVGAGAGLAEPLAIVQRLGELDELEDDESYERVRLPEWDNGAVWRRQNGFKGSDYVHDACAAVHVPRYYLRGVAGGVGSKLVGAARFGPGAESHRGRLRAPELRRVAHAAPVRRRDRHLACRPSSLGCPKVDCVQRALDWVNRKNR